MKEMTRKEFLKLTGASTALLAMSHIIPTSAYADTSKIDAPSAGMYISEVVDLSGLACAVSDWRFLLWLDLNDFIFCVLPLNSEIHKRLSCCYL